MTQINEQRCGEILKHYGILTQRQQLVEECAELIQAACKLQRGVFPDELETAQHNFIEELADVEIMVEQMKQTLTPMEIDTFNRIETAKINRQLRRIEKGE